MSEASGGGGDARAEMERRLVQRSIEDDAFRQRLIEDPKGALEQELGARLPEEVRIVTVEESADTIYLVLPSTPMAGAEGAELSDQELESVAGGWDPFPKTCNNTELWLE
jgi:Nitrile hydratase, alpha chain